ncbi:potassium channel family protein [Pontixanthobacter gangjinensis]|uniref:Two pore domain potassium channel family protein n=1 Tax=Pontixanthobacter gangjinensis TaxID=1028742 RepID=A0A6I4SKH4_9SPHN|nr:two pore domain potassium channel family protein [Pontixanthobacter gangjinensis]MXO56154.1 two pore domain potassium channel family protein [Pontixanthobacter gangjinensis]
MLLVTFLIAMTLVALTFVMHFAILKFLAREIRNEGSRLKWPLLTVTFSLFVAHLLEVLLYALAFLAIDMAGIGGLQGAVHSSHATLADHFYFSIASYTTLGIGDIVPLGSIRLVAGFEALNGLVLIAWSASFTYLMMERLWRIDGDE